MKSGKLLLSLLLFPWVGTLHAAPPNVVIIFADDMGYGDAGCYGSTKNRTPNLDRLAAEGLRSERFYVAQPVCSASRAALMTGCYPSRVGIQGALGPKAKTGLNPEETTIAEIVKQKGYATAAVGKWHLGDASPMLPLDQGFDHYLGLPYSNDMWPLHPEANKRRAAFPPLPLLEDRGVKIPEVTSEEQKHLTTWYTERAVEFIRGNKGKPFFLYVAHSMPHVPLFTSGRSKSPEGAYAEVIEEIDWSVGEVMRALEETGADANTLVIFTSDNGPWLNYGDHSGVATPLREGKGTVWEGGVRVPFIARYPGKIPAGTVGREPMMTIDLLPTIAGLVGAELPARKIDGLDVLPLLTGKDGAKSPHDAYFFYYKQNELHAVMSGDWKLYLPHQYRTLGGKPGGRDGKPVPYEQRNITSPQLYNVATDISEEKDVAGGNPEVVGRLLALAEKARKDLGDSLTGTRGEGVRPPGRME